MFEITSVQHQRERLAELLRSDLNFHGEDSGYASHDLHAFAAKFPPQLPRAFIQGLTSPGEIVLDPMMGSGTTVVEALLAGRLGIGLDLDPLAIRLGGTKAAPLSSVELEAVGRRVLAMAQMLLSNEQRIIDRYLDLKLDERTRRFIDYWFLPQTQQELMALAVAIGRIEDASLRRFLELTFSSTIVAKSGGVSRARDLAHSRPHLVQGKAPKNAVEQFAVRLRKNLSSMNGLGVNKNTAVTLMGDARSLPLADGMVDLIVTSPPYANAIDYMRAHKFSLVWFDLPVARLSSLRGVYIGSEKAAARTGLAILLPDLVEATVHQLAERDRKKAAVLRKYFAEMTLVLAEMFRVLREDAAAVVVVGTSTMRGMDVQTHICLAEIAASAGFEVVGIARRILDRNKRMMPARFGSRRESTIEHRMHDEHVIGLYKAKTLPCNGSP